MTPAKFRVGESVIVVSKSEGTFITEVESTEYSEAWRDTFTLAPYIGWCYGVWPDRGAECAVWDETCLRKRPKGNGKTLTEFMDSLKQPEVTTCLT